jgi:hypothetical protein
MRSRTQVWDGRKSTVVTVCLAVLICCLQLGQSIPLDPRESRQETPSNLVQANATHMPTAEQEASPLPAETNETSARQSRTIYEPSASFFRLLDDFSPLLTTTTENSTVKTNAPIPCAIDGDCPSIGYCDGQYCRERPGNGGGGGGGGGGSRAPGLAAWAIALICLGGLLCCCGPLLLCVKFGQALCGRSGGGGGERGRLLQR